MKKILLPTLLSLVTASAACAGEYHLLKEIPVGGDGGWDYLSVDSAGQRLYVSHGTKVVVIDTAKDVVAGEITNTPGVHGLAPAPDLGRGFVSCGREDKCAIVDLKTFQIISKVDTGKNPDAMLYDPARQEVYMFNHTGGSATVIDAKAGKVIATVPLDGKVEFGVVDTKAERVFVNLEDKSELVAIDTKTHTVKNRWPIAPGEEATGIAFNEKTHHLFLGCGGSKTMVMMDSTSGKVLASVPIGDGVDANSFDPASQLAFASCSDGTVTIAKEDGDKLTVVQTLKTEKGSRTMVLDPATQKIYLAAAKFDAPAAGQRRGKMAPGSFKVLVYGPEK